MVGNQHHRDRQPDDETAPPVWPRRVVAFAIPTSDRDAVKGIDDVGSRLFEQGAAGEELLFEEHLA